MKKRVKAAPGDDWFGSIDGEFFEVELRALTSPPDGDIIGYRVVCRGTDDFLMIKDFGADYHWVARDMYRFISDGTSIKRLKANGFEVF